MEPLYWNLRKHHLFLLLGGWLCQIPNWKQRDQINEHVKPEMTEILFGEKMIWCVVWVLSVTSYLLTCRGWVYDLYPPTRGLIWLHFSKGNIHLHTQRLPDILKAKTINQERNMDTNHITFLETTRCTFYFKKLIQSQKLSDILNTINWIRTLRTLEQSVKS